MEIEFTKTFSKQIDSLHDESLKLRLAQVVQNVISANTLQDIINLKKLKGHQAAYRIRVGDYRVGLFFEEGVIVFAYLAHRKEIYNRFPK
jgi:mRNA interferase RelE/StbE